MVAGTVSWPCDAAFGAGGLVRFWKAAARDSTLVIGVAVHVELAEIEVAFAG